MEQHPVPQQISSYQFRLVGDMTLKQFFQLAGGILVSLLIYATGIHPIIKWPLMIFFAIFGAALAFVPLEERPLEIWIIDFFRSVYSPTVYFWQKSNGFLQFFQPEVAIKTAVPEVKIQGEVQINKAGLGGEIFSILENTEKSFLEKISRILVSITQPTPKQAPSTIATTTPAAIANDVDDQSGPKFVELEVIPVRLQKPQLPKIETPVVKPKVVIPQSKLPFVSSQGYLPPIEVKQDLVQPSQGPVQVSSSVGQTLVGQSQKNPLNPAQFSPSINFPNFSNLPNIVYGQVTDNEGKIVEGAILEIRDKEGRPVRAFKTNKVGHFAIVTPLVNGTYQIIIEKTGLLFDPLTFETIGQEIPPILVKAKGKELS